MFLFSLPQNGSVYGIITVFGPLRARRVANSLPAPPGRACPQGRPAALSASLRARSLDAQAPRDSRQRSSTRSRNLCWRSSTAAAPMAAFATFLTDCAAGRAADTVLRRPSQIPRARRHLRPPAWATSGCWSAGRSRQRKSRRARGLLPHQACGTPGYRMPSPLKALKTADMARAQVANGKTANIDVGRAAIRARGSFGVGNAKCL